ncbi:MAG TPA: acyl carrier protein [Bryobacteraceae bacterium]|jgi:acyl carrier protein|nr:acyl carrier protein [Bryobacteraceae bacterium]
MNRREKIIQIVKQVSGKPTVPDADESLFESGYLDSFALTDMVSALEKEFQVQVPDSDLTPRKFESVERIENYLESRT